MLFYLQTEVMESFNLKSSKFDVCLEGKLNLQYRHPVKGSVKVGSPVQYRIITAVVQSRT